MVRTLGNEWNPNEGTFVVELGGVKGNNPRVIALREVSYNFLILLAWPGAQPKHRGFSGPPVSECTAA